MRKALKKLKAVRLTLKYKLVLSLLSIAAILMVSSTISVMEYTSMSSYVSTLIADDIRNINLSRRLSEMSSSYNLEILEIIGEEGPARMPEFDDGYFKSQCDSLRSSGISASSHALADSVLYSYAAYMLTSLELPEVAASDFINTRDWYFDRLKGDIDKLAESMYRDLEKNSATFDRGFYRSIIPGIVAVGVGLLLVLMLLFFVLAFYVNPLYRMLEGMRAYRSADKKYTVRFDGDDELAELNEGIGEITGENQQLRRRIKALKK